MAIQAPIRTLLRPVRIAVVVHYLGQLALVLAALSAIPAVIAALLSEFHLALTLVLGAVVPSLLLALGARTEVESASIQTSEAMAVTVLVFALAALMMTVPFHFAGMPLTDALFEAVSGVTTTGLSTRFGIADASPGLLFLRSWTQFIGGLGFIVLAFAVVTVHGAESRRLSDPAGTEEDLAENTRTHARRVLAVYLFLSVLGMILMWALGLDPYSALLHTLSGVSTGGFSSFDDSLSSVPRGAQIAAAFTSLAAALPLILYYRAFIRKRETGGLWRDPELLALVFAVTLTAVLLWLTDALAPLDAVLQAVNAQTTTGYSTIEIENLSPAGKLTLILSMVTGAGLGSTGGGLKLLRVLILLRLVHLLIVRSLLPHHAVTPQRLSGSRITDEQISRITGVILLYLLVIVLSWMAFLFAGHDPLNALFEVASATATAGLSTGLSAPELEPWLKGLLCFDMLAGRLEVLALVVVLYPRTWISRTR